MVIDESYESSDVDHGDNGGESDDDGEKIVIINASSKGCFFFNKILQVISVCCGASKLVGPNR